MMTYPVSLMGQQIKTAAEAEQCKKQLQKTEPSRRKVDLLTELGAYYLNLKGELKADLNTASNYQRQSISLANVIGYPKGILKNMILQGDILRESGDKNHSRGLYEQVISLARKQNLNEQLAEADLAMANLFGNEGIDLDKKISFSEQALSLYQVTENKVQQANILKDLGDYYTLKGQSAHAIKLLDASLAVYQSIRFKELQGVYNNLCYTSIKLGNLSHALEYGLMAEKTAEKNGDTTLQRCSILKHLGLTYFYLRNNDKTLACWTEAKKIAEGYQDAGYTQTVLANLATLLTRMKRFDEGIALLKELEIKYPPADIQMKVRIPYILFNTYYDLKEYKKAAPYYKLLVDFHHKLPEDDVNQIYLYRSIIKKLVYDKQYSKVVSYLQEHEKQTLEQKNILALSQLHQLWANVDSATNKPWSALMHYKTYKRLSDSVYNQEKNQQLMGLEIEYQTEKKDRDIALLNQRNQLQQVRIENQTSLRYIFIAVLIIAGLFLALVYNRYRLREQSNLVMQEKQKEINGQNDLLRKILSEKEWLLREIHHRVKNNLQIVISLLNTQSAYLENPDALTAIKNSQNRMHAMSLIHQKLYQSDNLAEIDMAWYIRKLVEYMIECFGLEQKIKFDLTTDYIQLDVAQAVPLGLILNEAISNAIKYAFPTGRTGTIRVSFVLGHDDTCVLTISDNGIGLPEDFVAEDTESLGMSLMTGLTSQLNGKISMWNDDGLTMEISFTKHLELSGGLIAV
ncbi:histidine kinase dimerization/phosphoacceptor domain -containing protein [Pedobacter sp. BAL39]|uniref:tetratricopeptide repeat-containing sensor histidine kinase n=1 Tax=Pedobacter sp. BAL39 TaxID=391596 RepID=UPI001E4D3CE3|nr:histidine kinase dimerization/phosphoacceptor domain -containing protein [Pedobacter sp. BAL39]